MGMLDSLKFMFGKEQEKHKVIRGKHTLTITEKGNMRLFKYNGVIHSMLYENSHYTKQYYDYFMPLPLLFDKAKVLVIGLGGGTIPYNMMNIYGKRVSVEVVEPNKDVIALSKKFLPKDAKKFKVFVDDGMSFVKKQNAKYDIIILDAFVTGSIPQEFFTNEFMEYAKRALKEKGILAVNYAPEYLYMHVYIHHLKKYFKTYRITHLTFGNYILICSKYYDKGQLSATISSRMRVQNENKHVINAYKAM